MTKPLPQDCTYCGARKNEPCKITLVPEIGKLSIRWSHRARGLNK